MSNQHLAMIEAGLAPEGTEDDGPDHDCPNCGGEGFVAHCWEEYACIDPEGGCDDCLHACDWCNQPNPSPHERLPRC